MYGCLILFAVCLSRTERPVWVNLGWFEMLKTSEYPCLKCGISHLHGLDLTQNLMVHQHDDHWNSNVVGIQKNGWWMVLYGRCPKMVVPLNHPPNSDLSYIHHFTVLLSSRSSAWILKCFWDFPLKTIQLLRYDGNLRMDISCTFDLSGIPGGTHRADKKGLRRIPKLR